MRQRVQKAGLSATSACRQQALRRGVGPVGRGNSSGDAVDKKPGPLDIFMRGDGEGRRIVGEEGR